MASTTSQGQLALIPIGKKKVKTGCKTCKCVIIATKVGTSSVLIRTFPVESAALNVTKQSPSATGVYPGTVIAEVMGSGVAAL